MSALVSVIVPVYKVEKELPKCLDSLLGQIYQNLEILVVDDGSPDQCPEICEDYAKKDKRIKVFHKENGGLSSARNFGLDRATGDYIAFVDSDDWVTDDFIEILVTNLEKEQADLSIIGYALAYSDGTVNPFYENQDEYRVFSKDQALRELMIQQKFQSMAWTKLHKKELFDDVRFPEGKLYEDAAISLDIFKQCEKVVFSGKSCYMYYQREDSIVNSGFKNAKLSLMDCADEMLEYSKEMNNLFETEAETYYLLTALLLILQAYNDMDKQEARQAAEYLKKKIKQHKKYISGNPYLPTRRKLVLWAIAMGVPAGILNKMWRVRVER